MSLIIKHLAGLFLCLIIGLLAFVFVGAFCMWGCTYDGIGLVLMVLFWSALSGLIYFSVKLVRSIHDKLTKNGTENTHDGKAL